MNPIVGLDVAKGESQVQAFLDQSKPYGKSFSMKHIKEELDHFLGFFRRDRRGDRENAYDHFRSYRTLPFSRYSKYLEEQEILYILLNPIISYQAKKSSLPKVKTDAIDAYQLCVLYYKEDFEPHKIRGIQLLDLRNLSRQQEIVTNMYVEAKPQFHTILDQVFPEYRKVFDDLYSRVSLLIVKKYPTSEAVLTAGDSKLAERVMEFCPSRSGQWAWGKAKKIMDSVSRNPFEQACIKVTHN
ncbi:transposase [Peribacillus butanolivorans]|uniref:IS110 family transposase n=1 Tax=Peribacillus butanolivorans TaxID=421767 RepID=UPI0036718F04